MYSNPDVEQRIAFFFRSPGDLNSPRHYKAHKYRSGLRHQRLLRILGRR